MRFVACRIQNYRSILDSGWITLGDLTVLVGKNEAGKTNVLRALESFSSGAAYDLAMDAPKSLEEDPEADMPVVTNRFVLEDEDLELLRKSSYQPGSNNTVAVTKHWGGRYTWEIPDVKARRRRVVDDNGADDVIERLNGVRKYLRGKVRKLEDTPTKKKLIDTFTKRRPAAPQASKLEQYIRAQCAALRNATNLCRESLKSPSGTHARIDDIEACLDDCFDYPPPNHDVVTVLREKKPEFRYFADFAEVVGKVNLKIYLQLLSEPDKVIKKTLDGEDPTERFKTTKQLFHLLQLDPARIVKLTPELRINEENRLARKAENILCPGWVQDIAVRVRLDGDYAMLLVSDVLNGEEQPATELRHRSEGFKTFLSFFVNCGGAIDGELAGTVLLLDEPGLHLHADQQSAFLDILKAVSRHNQVVYTSHSPWMLPEEALNSIVTVEKKTDGQTQITHKWWTQTTDTTLTIRKALGISRTHELVFPGKRFAVAVEGPSDAIILQTFAEVLARKDRKKYVDSLEVAFRPAGGTKKLPGEVAAAQNDFEEIVTVVDSDKAGLEAKQRILEGHIVPKETVFTIGEALGTPGRSATIEDLIPAETLFIVMNDYLATKRGVPRARLPSKREFVAAVEKTDGGHVWPVIARFADSRVKDGRGVEKVPFALHLQRLWTRSVLDFQKAALVGFRNLFLGFRRVFYGSED